MLFGLFGAGLGGYVGFLTNGVVGAIGGACVGGFLGWFLAMVLTGMFLILGGVLVIALVLAGWFWLTGGTA